MKICFKTPSRVCILGLIWYVEFRINRSSIFSPEYRQIFCEISFQSSVDPKTNISTQISSTIVYVTILFYNLVAGSFIIFERLPKRTVITKTLVHSHHLLRCQTQGVPYKVPLVNNVKTLQEVAYNNTMLFTVFLYFEIVVCPLKGSLIRILLLWVNSLLC